jgi:hypothetical protein
LWWGNKKTETVTTTVEATQPSGTSTSSEKPGVPFAFDSLGSDLSKGGSNVIQVYAGPESTDADRQVTGTFMSGQSANGECKEAGREVHSDPSAGELQRKSDEWIHVQSPNAEEMWATAVYIKNPDEVLGKLPEC